MSSKTEGGKSSRLFGGMRLNEIAGRVKESGEGSAVDRGAASHAPSLAGADLALKGRTQPGLERESIFSVDPQRVRPWKFHNRTDAWYTAERCADVISSIAKDGQQEPALARRIEGDPNFDFELIYGMRRRFACVHLNKKLKVRVVDADDTQAAVLMHIENADREDITAMERALSFHTQVQAKLFPTQDALAEAVRMSKGQVAKMLKAAELLQHPTLTQLFPDKSAVPVEQAYKVAAVLERPGAKEVILQAAKNQLRKDGPRDPRAVLKALLESLDRSQKVEPLQRQYNLGASRRVVVTRNPRGKVTLSFPQGLQGVEPAEVMATIEKIIQELA